MDSGIQQAMQTNSLSAAVGLLQGRELLEEEALCINVRGRVPICDHCVKACHSDALSATLDSLEVDRERCSGCGGCVPACPAGALRLTGFSPGHFLEALSDEPEVHLHCTLSSDSGGGVVVPCFKVLDERLLGAAAAAGVRHLHLHGLDQCRGCRHGGAWRQVARARGRVRRWLGADLLRVNPARGDAEVVAGPRRRQDQVHLSRRSFLRFGGVRASEGVARWLVPAEDEEADIDLPFFQGDPDPIRQPHPYQSLLARRVATLPWKAGIAPPWQARSLAAQCNACLACGRRCPTGALRAREDQDSRSISFESALCTHCGLCEAVCPVTAIEVGGAQRAAEVNAPRATLMMQRLTGCDHCGSPFVPSPAGETRCPVCCNEQDLDDEWMAMLEG